MSSTLAVEVCSFCCLFFVFTKRSSLLLFDVTIGLDGTEMNGTRCVPYSICTALKDTIRNRIIHHSNQYICTLMSLVRPDLQYTRWHTAGLDG